MSVTQRCKGSLDTYTPLPRGSAQARGAGAGGTMTRVGRRRDLSLREQAGSRWMAPDPNAYRTCSSWKGLRADTGAGGSELPFDVFALSTAQRSTPPAHLARGAVMFELYEQVCGQLYLSANLCRPKQLDLDGLMGNRECNPRPAPVGAGLSSPFRALGAPAAEARDQPRLARPWLIRLDASGVFVCPRL